MRIKKLSIKNFRNFKEFEIELMDFTLIIGENNIGKTNLLNAIGLIFSSEISFIAKRNLSVDDINYSSIREFKRQLVDKVRNEDIRFPEVKIEIWLGNFDEDQESIVGDWFTGEWDQEISKNKAKITYVFSKREDLVRWLNEQKEILSRLIQEEGESPEAFYERKISYVDFPIDYYGYSVFGGDDSTKTLDFRLLRFLKFDLVNALRNPEADLLASGHNTVLYKILNYKTENKLEEVKEQLLKLQRIVKGNSELAELKNEIEKYLKTISLVGDDYKIDFDFAQMESSEMLKKLSMIYGTDPVPIMRNGLGRNNLLFLSLLLSHLIKKDTSKKRVFFRLVGIEEPEAHLHPHLQENLSMNIISGCDDYIQIIATSHSTHVTSKLPLDNTIVLYKDNGCVKSYYLLKNVPQSSKIYLQKYLDATKATMFYARRIILVEGISEQLLIPKLFGLYKSNTLEQYGCNILNVNGVAFKHFLETVKAGYFIRCAVVTDSDSNKTKRAAERANRLAARYGSEKILVKITSDTLSTFEKEIIDANKSGIGKELLLEALTATRPIKGKSIRREVGIDDINVEQFFNKIEVKDSQGNKQDNHKSEFAINLLNILNTKSEEAKSFVIPQYIKDVFDFIIN